MKRLSGTNLSLENNLPTFWLNAPVVSGWNVMCLCYCIILNNPSTTSQQGVCAWASEGCTVMIMISPRIGCNLQYKYRFCWVTNILASGSTCLHVEVCVCRFSVAPLSSKEKGTVGDKTCQGSVHLACWFVELSCIIIQNFHTMRVSYTDSRVLLSTDWI